MRNIKFREIFSSAILFIAMVVCFSSCEKDDEIASDYVGTWIALENMPISTGYTPIRDVMTFTENTVVDLMQIPAGSA